ncbi:hypothetical protein V9K67_09440 [Paraflavisolibacter sp. H34]|uniref:hypothetical protein n=1 Tax=Huijunlia imazamoxiresistens TaxID=3127457 RepID=UPI0030186439
MLLDIAYDLNIDGKWEEGLVDNGRGHMGCRPSMAQAFTGRPEDQWGRIKYEEALMKVYQNTPTSVTGKYLFYSIKSFRKTGNRISVFSGLIFFLFLKSCSRAANLYEQPSHLPASRLS